MKGYIIKLIRNGSIEDAKIMANSLGLSKYDTKKLLHLCGLNSLRKERVERL